MTALQPKRNAVADSLFHSRRMTHVNLFINNLDETMEFYTKICGLAEAYRVPATGGGFVSNGNTHHDLGVLDIKGPLGFRARKGEVGLYHLGFETESEAAMVKDFERAKHQVALRPVDHDVAHSLYTVAPNGYTSEIYADVIKEFQTARTGTVTKAKPDWYPGKTPPVEEPRYHEKPVFARVEGAPLHPQRFSHLVLSTETYESDFDHYTNIVGLSPRIGGRDSAFVALGGSAGMSDLWLFRHRSGVEGCHHISFLVADVDDLRQSIVRLGDQGIKPELVLDHPGRLCVYLRDPQGVLVQFYADKQPIDWSGIDEHLTVLLA